MIARSTQYAQDQFRLLEYAQIYFLESDVVAKQLEHPITHRIRCSVNGIPGVNYALTE